ncbi:hypothetical protein [Actinomadura sp. HBU206391]|uniref:hypothetical protein n=1 Tax=Actinomadura sp. HBU206391 TaxID=2731692 RepID=UPI00164FF783|nr:hypothetical protein [Actinomadura sp. HBU206391]MBC6459524.1 hypothetical protein [Actinomadura sp. HBU206391]
MRQVIDSIKALSQADQEILALWSGRGSVTPRPPRRPVSSMKQGTVLYNVATLKLAITDKVAQKPSR